MRLKNIVFFMAWSLVTIASCACSKDSYTIPIGSDQIPQIPTTVQLRQTEGVWQLLCNGTPMYIKGAACNNFHGKAAAFGANVVRTYSCVADNTIDILDEAYDNGLYVNMGIYIKRETDGFDYNNTAAVAAQFESVKTCVKKFMNHPALLMWSIGNEAEASYTNTKLWSAINDIAKMIHELDPNHPTTTVLASSKIEHILNIKRLAPEVDILSVNTYAPNLPGVIDNLRAAEWTKPYMITEFGPRGTWQMGPEPSRILPWGALVEQTSTEKEADYLKAYTESIKANEVNGCIGSFVFLWGYQTHGEVLNWYGLFDKQGNTYGAVDAMQYAWTGEYPAHRAPRIESRNDVKMNGKVAEDIIMVDANSDNSASVVATTTSGVTLKYKWLIYKEGAKSADGSMPDGIAGLIADAAKSSITFKAPTEAGGYRLYVFAIDDVNKKVASGVIPFCVK